MVAGSRGRVNDQPTRSGGSFAAPLRSWWKRARSSLTYRTPSTRNATALDVPHDHLFRTGGLSRRIRHGVYGETSEAAWVLGPFAAMICDASRPRTTITIAGLVRNCATCSLRGTPCESQSSLDQTS